jgi:hypothetical protein
MKTKENLLEHIGYHYKWHGNIQPTRLSTKYSINEPLIQEIFKRLGITKGRFLEFGAWDGLELSNTKLLEEQGWSGILIEPDITRFRQLVNNFKHNPDIICLNKFIDTEKTLLDDVLKEYKYDHLDFCSIDIDGLDLEIFESIQNVQPTVVCIEGGQVLDPFNPRISTDISRNNIGQSLSVFVDAFSERGYSLLCCYQDCCFIKKEVSHLFNVSTDILEHYIQGILALPRIPYLKTLLDQNNLVNNIIDTCITSTSPINGKTAWVERNYALLENHLTTYYNI